MKKPALFFLVITLSLYSCKQEKETPKVIYEDASKAKAQPVKPDSSQIRIADLPIQMPGTKYLIHPIGDYRISDGKESKYVSSSAGENISFSISNFNEFEITGYLQNLKFQHQDSLTIHTLTDRRVIIQSATYLNMVAWSAKKQLFVYDIIDSDTNRDGKMDGSDIHSLYISEGDGRKFTKLSVEMQELIDWNILESKNRLYFRSIEDTNKNGKFDQGDVLHYHFADLTAKEIVVQDYNPVDSK